MKLSMYKKILQDSKNGLIEEICQLEWRIKIIETYERAVEDYKQNPTSQGLTVTEEIQLEKEFDRTEEDHTGSKDNFLGLTDTERKLGLNNPEVYKPFVANLKSLRRPPAAAKPISRTEYHINGDEDNSVTNNDD
jgi:hypothetical protein